MSNDVHELRAMLFDTIRRVRDGSMDTDSARAINATAAVIVDSARVEIEHIKAVGEGHSQFLALSDDSEDSAQANALPPGIVSVRRHRIKG